MNKKELRDTFYQVAACRSFRRFPTQSTIRCHSLAAFEAVLSGAYMRKKESNALSFSVIWQSREVRKRLFFTLACLVLFRTMAFIPVPYLAPDLLLNNPYLSNRLLNMYDLFNGGSLGALSALALGIGPYISASIVIQLLASTWSSLKNLRQEGERGQRKLKRITYGLTFALALFESCGIANIICAQAGFSASLPPLILSGLVVGTLSLGVMLAVLLAELISKHGIGNGSSLFICAGILARLPMVVRDTWVSVETKSTPLWAVGVTLLSFIAAGVIAVILQEGMKKLLVVGGKPKHSRLQRDNRTHLYLPMNPAGIMPIVFASQIMVFAQMIVSVLGGQFQKLNQSLLQNKTASPVFSAFYSNDVFQGAALAFWNELNNLCSSAHWEYYFVYFALIASFSLFYSEMILPAGEIAENLRKSNCALAGIRPGRATVQFLRSTIQKLALVGAAVVALIAIMPAQIAQMTQVQTLLGFGSTSLIILTGVALDTKRQLSAYASSSRYHKRYILPPPGAKQSDAEA
jgi:preprotein translocase subunit SecY